jgi:hypothetical protein
MLCIFVVKSFFSSGTTVISNVLPSHTRSHDLYLNMLNQMFFPSINFSYLPFT